ncbi:MAG: tetratricopeptide repeat protein [Candidatus Bruticola sp.]
MPNIAAHDDQTKNFRIYLQGAEQGQAQEQYKVGLCYYYGRGVSKNEENAVFWWRKAAEQGLSVAQFQLGEYYLYGQNLNLNRVEAFKWYRLAAEAGYARAQC